MQQKLKVNTSQVFYIFLLLILLVMVRIFQKNLFYDPLLPFFQSTGTQLPDYDSVKLFLGLTFRYLLNSIITLAILWVAFKDRQIVKLSAMLLSIFFVVLIVVLFTLLNVSKPSLLAIFYIRRFLIQPLFLILFLPAFYYQKHMR